MPQELNRTLFSRFLAECVGTFFLVLFGPGAAIVFVGNTKFEHVMISLVFGGVVAGACSLLGPISGGHINPAATLAARLRGEVTNLESVLYVIAQLLGGVLAALLLKLIFPMDWQLKHVQTRLDAGVPLTGGVLLELSMTAALLLAVILAPGKWKPATAGLVVFLDALVGGPVTGASMNPARSLGPFFASGFVAEWWIYVAGPLLGAVVAVLIAKVLRRIERKM